MFSEGYSNIRTPLHRLLFLLSAYFLHTILFHLVRRTLNSRTSPKANLPVIIMAMLVNNFLITGH